MVDSIYDAATSIRWVFDVASNPSGSFNNLKELRVFRKELVRKCCHLIFSTVALYRKPIL